MLRTRRQPGWRVSAALGLLLGLGYLAKAPMLPLAVVFLMASTLVLEGRARRVSHLLVASVMLALAAGPFVLVLSVANGRPTVGDSALLNYLWEIDGVPVVHWQGGPDGVGQPLHHSQLVLERPAIYALESPFPVTYAAWYAPEYWFAGATPVFFLGGQLRAIFDAVQVYGGLAADLAVEFAALAVLLSLRPRPWRIAGGPALVLLAPAVAALGMYALVLAEARYVAPFVLLLLLGLLLLVQLPETRWSAQLAARASVIMVVVLVLQIAWATSGSARSVLAQIRQGRLLEPDDQVRVARALRSAGIGPGDRVASGNRAFNDYWARLARVRIVAEVSERDAPAVLDADAAARAAAQQVLLAQNVRVIVARAWPALTDDPGWQPIEGTDYFYHLVPARLSRRAQLE
jgi:hypothetical protein